MRTVRRIALGFAAAVAALVYVWFAAVRAVPEVRRRKAARRAARAHRAGRAEPGPY